MEDLPSQILLQLLFDAGIDSGVAIRSIDIDEMISQGDDLMALTNDKRWVSRMNRNDDVPPPTLRRGALIDRLRVRR